MRAVARAGRLGLSAKQVFVGSNPTQPSKFGEILKLAEEGGLLNR